MKTIFTLFIAFTWALAQSQAPVFNVVTEEIPISEPAFSEIQSALGATPHSIRIYAEFPDGYELQLVYGNSTNPMSISGPEGFYQNTFGGPTTLDITSALYGTFPALAFDSWLTVGYEDNTSNNLFILPLDMAFFDTWEAGGDLFVNDLIGAAISVNAQPTSFPPNTPDENGRVLIGQITSAGDISACLNYQIRKLNPDGTIYNPPGSATSEVWTYTDQCFTHSFSTPTCVGDFDLNGVIAVSDLLLFMPEFGCTTGCTKDLTGDENVSTSDILILLGFFGTTCP